MTAQQSAPFVGVVMGSSSDWEVMRHTVNVLTQFGIPFEMQVVSAHHISDDMFGYAEATRGRGLRAIIAGVGGAAHPPGVITAKTIVPAFGVPVPSRYPRSEDSPPSIVQMPKGISMSTFAIGEAGATDAALAIITTVATTDLAPTDKLETLRAQQTGVARGMTFPVHGA